MFANSRTLKQIILFIVLNSMTAGMLLLFSNKTLVKLFFNINKVIASVVV